MPKKGKDDVFRLVKSLDKTEKAYFKKFAERHVLGDKNNYLKLFDALDKQTNYDEKKILKEERYITQLPYLKNYLTDIILKAMQAFYAEHTQEHKLRRMMDDSWFLYKKGLYDMCEPVLLRAKKISTDTFTGYPFLEAVKMQGALVGVLGDNARHADHIDKNLTEERELLEDMLLFNKINEYYMKAYLHLRKHSTAHTPADLKKLKTEIGDPLLTLSDKIKTFRCTAHFHQALAVYCGIINDLKGYYGHNRSLVLLCRKHPDFIKNNVTYYLSVLNNFGLSCCHLKKFPEALKVVKEINGLKTENQHEKRKIFITAINLEMFVYKNSGNFKKVAEVFERHRQELTAHLEIFLQRYFMLGTYALVAHAYTGNYKKALRLISDIFSHPEIKKFEWLERILNILQIIFLSELGQDVDSFIKNLRRKTNLKEDVLDSTSVILEHLEKGSAMKTGKAKASLVKNTLHKLGEFSKEKSFLQLTKEFDIISWLESKVSGRPIMEIIQKKLKKS